MAEWLKIKVVRCDGAHEILTLAGPVRLSPAVEGGQHCLITATGAEHFFRAEDGAYDGWGMAVNIEVPLEDIPEDGSLPEVVKGFAAAVEADRDVSTDGDRPETAN